MKRHTGRLSINKRLALVSLSVFVPMVVLVCYLFQILASSTNAYNEITKTVFYASGYVNDFKERLDYSMYLAVIDGRQVDSMSPADKTMNGIILVNPYKYIDEMTDACDDLSEMATVETNKKKITRMKKTLESLRKCVTEIDNNISVVGNYDENMDLLNNNIYSLTSVIKGELQDYIYMETQNLSEVRARLEARNRVVFQICGVVIILTAVLVFVLTTLASRSVTKPIKKLCDMTTKVAKGDFTARTNPPSPDEIAVLTNCFNDMTAEIGCLVEDIKKEQEQLHFIETRLLQAQINPHFLYNTLDAIVWLAEEKQTDAVVEMVTALSNFFRTTLSEGHDYVSVSEEELHIKSYMEIQRFRYQDILSYEIHMDKGILDYTIPKLTLQPIVENALYHGIKNKRGGGKIWISGELLEDHLIFRVRDNGIGMKPEVLEKLQKDIQVSDHADNQGGSFGLWNVNERIKHYYGEDYGIYFESTWGEGTKVTILLGTKNITPFSKNNDHL